MPEEENSPCGRAKSQVLSITMLQAEPLQACICILSYADCSVEQHRLAMERCRIAETSS